MANGWKVDTAMMKISVRLTSTTVSARSLGVMRRSAPSTRAIIGSRKVCPGSAVIWTTIWSDSTLVLPVTAERSPPDSRITGADSPVIADSSTNAMPSMTSPSPGISCPAVTTQRSPTLSLTEGTSRVEAVGLQHVRDRFLPRSAQRVGLRLAAPLGHRVGERTEEDGEPEEKDHRTSNTLSAVLELGRQGPVGDSLTGAVRLYERVGFTVDNAWTSYRKQLC
jgi:hypothetical protein